MQIFRRRELGLDFDKKMKPKRVKILQSCAVWGYKGNLSGRWDLACGHSIARRFHDWGKHPKTTLCLECTKPKTLVEILAPKKLGNH